MQLTLHDKADSLSFIVSDPIFVKALSCLTPFLLPHFLFLLFLTPFLCHFCDPIFAFSRRGVQEDAIDQLSPSGRPKR